MVVTLGLFITDYTILTTSCLCLGLGSFITGYAGQEASDMYHWWTLVRFKKISAYTSSEVYGTVKKTFNKATQNYEGAVCIV